MTDVETHLGVIYGARRWEVNRDGRLFSPFHDGSRWVEGDMHAYCKDEGRFESLAEKYKGIDSPTVGQLVSHSLCGCGFYSYRHLRGYDNMTTGSPFSVFGITANWGRIFEGRYGQRAEYTRIVALLVPDGAVGAVRTAASWWYRATKCKLPGSSTIDHWNTDFPYFTGAEPCSCKSQIDQSEVTRGLISCGRYVAKNKFNLVKQNYPSIPVYTDAAAILSEYEITL